MSSDRNEIYLDNNATAAIFPEVLEEMISMLRSKTPLNPSSTHLFGQRARYMLEEARADICSSLFGDRAQNYRAIFTSSATEANNQIIRSFSNGIILTSVNEHPSVLEPSKELNHRRINIAPNGLLEASSLESALSEGHDARTLVSVAFCSGETGILQTNFNEIINTAHNANALFHSDCSQVIGKCSIERVFNTELDYATISSHKTGGPFGIAALIYRKNKPPPFIMMSGGGQEFGLRASTESAILARCFALAIKKASEKYQDNRDKLANMQSLLESSVKKLGGVIVGEDAERLPNTSMIFMPKVSSVAQVAGFDLSGIMVSSGSACSSGKNKANEGLMQMGLSKEFASNCVRVSTSFQNTESDILLFCKKWKEIQSIPRKSLY